MRRALISVLLAVSMAAGCSDDGDDTSADTTTTAETTAAPRSTSATTSSVPALPPTTSGGIEPVRRAAALCESLAAEDPDRATVLTSAPSVAGAVAAELAGANAPTAPWDALPSDHFVAVCTYAGTPDLAQPPPTITCPDGAIVLDVATDALYVDGEGRTSDASAVHTADACVEPPPLP